MQEVYGNLWNFNNIVPHNYIAITTNGSIRKYGCAVMGRETAQQAAKRYPTLPAYLGTLIKRYGNHVFSLPSKLITIPVKHNWYEKADLSLIDRSLHELTQLATDLGAENIFMPRPGCGNGQLDWGIVRPFCEVTLDHRFTIVEWKRG